MAPDLPDRAQRELILRELDRNVMVEAAAGTGKTTSMVGRMVALLRTGACAAARHLAAVTFTRKAAAELRGRFQLTLERSLRDERALADVERARLQAALAHLEQCFVGTIHAFCARLLRERPVEARVDLAFEELEPEDDLRLRAEAWAALADGLAARDEAGLLAALTERGLTMSELEPAFVLFADYPDVEAWPAPADVPLPDLEPAVSALEDYLQHMRRLAPRVPEDYGNDTIIPEYRRLPRIISHLGDLRRSPARLMQALARFDYRSKQVVQRQWKRTGRFTAAEARAELARWNLFHARHVAPTLAAWYEHRYGPVLQVLRRAREIYDGLRAARGRLNYQDLLMRSAALLRDKPHVRRYFRRRFTHLLVDEFQDTDPIQAEVMLLLTAVDPQQTDWQRCRPRPGALFVVGDPKQSIYRFRRADIVTYNRVREIITAADEGTAAELSANFRAAPEVIDWVNAVFEPRFPERATDASPEYVPLRAARALRGEVRALWIPDEHAATNEAAVAYESDRIARTIRATLDGGAGATPSDYMIITLKRANLGVYARALQRHGVPHRVSGGNALNRVEAVRLLYLCLKAAVQPDNPVALVAALRSELFGVSDAALYAFKRAGGTFAFTAPLPDACSGGALEDALGRLMRYHTWLTELTPAAAMERIVSDLGLMVQAAARPGGDVEAGSLAKVLEILRRLGAARREIWSAAQLVEHLGSLVDQLETHDGISAMPARGPAVRVMNLHKAKGLEAPVVFLADPTGRPRAVGEEVTIHIDRVGPLAQGYLAVNGPARGFRAPRLAQPEAWAELVAREQAFVEAERLRLLYVAATRAGRLLVISQRRRRNDLNPWQPFERALAGMGDLEDPGGQAPSPVEVTASPLEDEAARAAVDIERRRRGALQPSYGASQAKRFALGTRPPVLPSAGAAGAGDGHGLEWGAVIHHLLQLALTHQAVDLLSAAHDALAERDLDPLVAPAAAAVVQDVMRSGIWDRARRGERQLVEVPFSVLAEDDRGPTVVRGVIDLVFRERDGWVLVDYKTDALAGRDPSALVEHYTPQVQLYAWAWRQCTGEPVKEQGLYFTMTGCYHVVG